VIVVSDPLTTRRIVSRIRSISRDVPLLARTRYMREVDPLEALGASNVVAEEFEGSIELVARALRLFRIPDSSILKFTDALREGGYGAIRGDIGLGIDPWLVELLQAVEAQWIEVPASLAGATSLAQLGIRAATGANILAVARGDATTANPPPSFALQRGDRLLVLGDPENLERLERLLAQPPTDA
jgi:CPA2 family monovalent cation:H+ antiporter-2